MDALGKVRIDLLGILYVKLAQAPATLHRLCRHTLESAQVWLEVHVTSFLAEISFKVGRVLAAFLGVDEVE